MSHDPISVPNLVNYMLLPGTPVLWQLISDRKRLCLKREPSPLTLIVPQQMYGHLSFDPTGLREYASNLGEGWMKEMTG